MKELIQGSKVGAPHVLVACLKLIQFGARPFV